MNKEQLKTELEKHFGYSDFKPGQLEPILSILGGNNTAATLPTGTGKSLIYQLSGYLLDGVVIIISPLLSLMQDQVAQLKYMGEKRTAALNSMLTIEEKQFLMARLHKMKFLFLSPEMMQNNAVMAKLKQIKIALFVVDEAHCISQWGLDFRSDYLSLGKARGALGNPLTLALTATATPKVMQDILLALNLSEETSNLFEGAVNRDNIYYKTTIVSSEDKNAELLDILKKYPAPGIIYFSSKAQADAVTHLIKQRTDLRAESYHSDRSKEDRITIQHQFLQDELDIICATSAFGMGINKQNIRYVIHYHMPNSIEEYVQEVGRAGRDGNPCIAVLFYTGTDVSFKLRMLQNDFPSPALIEQTVYAKKMVTEYANPTQETLLNYTLQNNLSAEEAKAFIKNRLNVKQDMLYKMKDYAETDSCKRAVIALYFSKECGAKPEQCCSSCNGEEPNMERFKKADNAFPKKQSGDWEKIVSDLFLLTKM